MVYNKSREAAIKDSVLSKPEGGLVSNELFNDIFSDSDLVFVEEDGKVYTDSLKVAKMFSKQHKNVIQSIRDHRAKISALCGNQLIVDSMYII